MDQADFPPYAEISWHSDLNAIRVKWKKMFMKLEEFEQIIHEAWGILKANNGHIWISDMYESEGVFPEDIMSYISSDGTIEKSNEAGVKWALTIMPKKVGLASMSTKKWQKDIVAKDSFTIQEFPDWETCQSWIKMQNEAVKHS